MTAMIDVDARHHDLLFLLGLAPLALGCAVGVPDDGGQFTSANPTPPGDASADSATDDEGDSAGSDTTGGMDASASASVSASVSVSASASDDGSSSDDGVSVSVSVSVGDDYGTTYSATTGLPPGGSPCEAYAYVVAGCYYGGDPAQQAMLAANCEAGVAYYSMYYGPACGAAFEDTRACISQLSCQELPSYGTPGFCDMENAAFSAACS